MEEGTAEPRNAGRNWKRQGLGVSPILEPPEDVQSCQHLDFNPVKLTEDF